MESHKEWVLIASIWALGAFFSIMSLLNSKIKTSNDNGTDCCEKLLLTILELLSHGTISGLVSVTTFAGLTHYENDLPMLLIGSCAVVAGIISDSILEGLKRRALNVK